ncbi:Fucose permease [Streptoalloteichus tenebrarius]|uniref:Fucose permease n=1 Tax=Streptoalloteichus tenebrarius (strain ATCC 17920 / DSM 40477 / JCM 4838 / CBS 697.72 / NBRC 16177 / NCIMB 11028 / NRRL B-12390 / A12253. 1 / ISP 5477) TaxID=1933 RepID=A0ABT1HQF5_STRSD|nr:Fucose permease [Streptoalloteichus tenebrarius]
MTSVFLLNGVVHGSWAGRVPALAERAGADPGALGFALLGMMLGLVVGAPLAGRVTARFGARRVVALSGTAAPLLLPVLGLATSPARLGASWFALGVSAGFLDVAMNVAAVVAVRELGRPLMPFFHAGFSAGGLLGSGGAALAAGAGLPPSLHFPLVTALGLLLLASVARSVPGAPTAPAARRLPLVGPSPVRRPVLWLLGLVTLCAAVGEGSSSDWAALFLVRERGTSESAGAVAYAVFSVAMVLTRLFGERVERRWGPTRLLAASGVLAATGLLTAVALPWAPAAYLGFGLAGTGLAGVFPVALGLAGQVGHATGRGGAREIGFVTTVSYSGFLGGPPLVGAIAQATSLAVALGAVAGLVALMVPAALLVARVTPPAPPPLSPPSPPSPSRPSPSPPSSSPPSSGPPLSGPPLSGPPPPGPPAA